MKILVDAMGGDNAPLCVLQGVSQAAAEFGDGMALVLLGEEKAIRDCAKENKIDLAPFEILNCTETIDMHDDPVKAVRHKKDSSLVKGLTMLKNGEADAFVSAVHQPQEGWRAEPEVRHGRRRGHVPPPAGAQRRADQIG